MGLRSAFRLEAEEILMYLLTEANAPVDKIQPYQLYCFQSLTVWEAVPARGWDIKLETSSIHLARRTDSEAEAD